LANPQINIKYNKLELAAAWSSGLGEYDVRFDRDTVHKVH